MGELNPAQKRGNAAALLPILVFLVLYLGCGLLFEYGLKIEMGFYQTPPFPARSRPPAAPTARSICSWTTCPASSRWRACS